MSEVTTARPPRLQSAVRTDLGRVRTNNEDLPIVDRDRGVYGVIDGVGGHAAGEVAASIAREVILQRLARPLGTPAERIREAIAIANNEIFKRSEESLELRGMTCVVTLAIIADGLLTIGHVGDSRLYKITADGISKLTHDHSPIGEREDARELSEAEAMRHPRRNEVFRDVGSAHRDKDEEDFVDISVAPFEEDCAILLCTDGLSDMLPSATIEQIARRHAGDAEQVAAALVRTANDAGGRDNITVVYVEAPAFARAVAGTSSRRTPANPAWRAARWIVRSRTTWFAVGTLAGVLAVLVLLWRMGPAPPTGSRTLIVGQGSTPGAFARIADAMNVARAGDVVQLEPGVYAEQVVVRDGVDLLARVPGSVTLARADGAGGSEWVSIAATGSLGGRISGIRIESTREAPVSVGLSVSAQSRTLDLVEVSGPMRSGIELLAPGAVTIHGSFFAVQGSAVTMGEGTQATISNSVFFRTGPPAPPISVNGAARPSLARNVFAGFGADIIKGVSAEQRRQLLGGNFMVAAEPWLLDTR